MERGRRIMSLQERRKQRLIYLALKTDLINRWAVNPALSDEVCSIFRREIDSFKAVREANKVNLPGDIYFPADRINDVASDLSIQGQNGPIAKMKSLTLQEKVNRRLKYLASKRTPVPSTSKSGRKFKSLTGIKTIRYPIIRAAEIIHGDDNTVWRGIGKGMRLKGKSLQEIRNERLKYFASIRQLPSGNSKFRGKGRPVITLTTGHRQDPISQSNGKSSGILFNALTAPIIQKHIPFYSAPLTSANQNFSSRISPSTTDETNQRQKLAEMWHSDNLFVANQNFSSTISPSTTDETNQRQKLAEMWHSNNLSVKNFCDHQFTHPIGRKLDRMNVTSLDNITSFQTNIDDSLSAQIIKNHNSHPSKANQGSSSVFRSTSGISLTPGDETNQRNELAKKSLFDVLTKITPENSCGRLTDSFDKEDKRIDVTSPLNGTIFQTNNDDTPSARIMESHDSGPPKANQDSHLVFSSTSKISPIPSNMRQTNGTKYQKRNSPIFFPRLLQQTPVVFSRPLLSHDSGPSKANQDSSFVVNSTPKISPTTKDEANQWNKQPENELSNILPKIATKNSCDLCTATLLVKND